MAPITHIVLIGFKDGITAERIKQIIAGMLKLKDICVNPKTQEPYILSMKGGKDNSPDGFQNGATHAFVVEFANEKDRDYYAQHDPAHIAVGQELAGSVSTVSVVDFADSVY
ncbi:hypothetical protein ACHAQA_006492 [Verticillium albo-atrum]